MKMFYMLLWNVAQHQHNKLLFQLNSSVNTPCKTDVTSSYCPLQKHNMSRRFRTVSIEEKITCYVYLLKWLL